MAQEITIEVFENNAKIYNKKNLRRSYASIPLHETEYIQLRPLGASSKFVLEVIIDKEYAVEYQKYLKKKGFTILGGTNYYHIENMLKDYHSNERIYGNIKDRMEEIEKDYNLMLKNNKPFVELENDDVKFYFLPYNDTIETLCDFIEASKTGISRFCKNRDITIVMNVIGYCNMIKGFFGFNFFDAESKKEESIDYSSNILINVDFSIKNSVYASALLLSGITSSKEDIELMNCHILAENLKYNK